MDKIKRGQSGLSLVELIITMIISAILFITIAMIIIYANQSWIKAARVTQALQGSRIAKKTMEYQIRSAITVPASFSASTNEPFVMSAGAPFEIAPDSQSIMFNVVDRNNGDVYKLDRFRMDNNNYQILYDYWYAYTDPSTGNTTYSHYPSSTVILLQDVQNMFITAMDSNPTTNIKVDIIQANNLLGVTGGQVMVSTTTFSVKTRNLK